jgi:hypothetical protein
MLHVSVEGADKCADLMADMMDTIEAFPVPMAEEFVTWQRNDMRRRYPKIDLVDPMTVATSIYPRSRLSARFKRGVKPTRSRRIVIKSTGRQRGGSQRPILRPALFERLCVRMAELLGNRIKWR